MMDRADLRLTTLQETVFLTARRDSYVSKSVAIYGEWSFGEIEAIGRLVRPTDNIVEVGSNIGAHTVFLARDVVPRGLVFAFEPRRRIFQILCANIALNGIGNCHAYQLGLGERSDCFDEGALDLGSAQNLGGLEIGAVKGAGEIVVIKTLDQCLGDRGKCALIKADVEGHERNVLLGAKKIIEQNRPVLYLENDRLESSSALLKYVHELGYQAYWHLVPAYRSNNLAGISENIFGGLVSINILCLPSERNIKVAGLTQVLDINSHPLKKTKT